MATRKLYALLVGINEYARPLIPNLKGTHKDVDNIQDYLKETYKETFELEIKVLKDGAATRGNIIKELEQHLGKASENDVALFFFAGHGSWTTENEAIKASNVIEIEKTLICHDSRTTKKYDLSENELLVLLNYIGRNKSDVIVMIDACHSMEFESHAGQITRSFDGIKQPRKVEHYLYDATVKSNKFYYFKEILKHKKVKNFPAPTYVGFYACNTSEYAEENEKGGWFTQGLIDGLKSNKTPQTYFQTYNAILSQMIDYPVNQTPIFEAYSGFDVNRIFINGSPSNKKTKRFKVFKDKNRTEYSIQSGAQLGFPLDLKRSISFNLFEGKDATEVVGTGAVQFVGMKNSPIHLSLSSTEYVDSYWAELLDFTITPMPIGFVGPQEDLDALNKGLDKQDIGQVIFVANVKECRFNLEWEEEAQFYRLYEKDRPLFILEFERLSIPNEGLLDLLISTLEHLHQWRFTVELSNPKSAIVSKDVVLRFNTPKIENTKAVHCVYSKGGFEIKTDLKNANSLPQKEYTKILLECEEDEVFEYEVGIKNASFSQDYYIACLLISADYGVIPLGFNINLPARGSIDNIIDSNYSSLLIGRYEDTNITNYLKIIISKDKLPTTEGFMLNELNLEQKLEDQLKSKAVAPERIRIFDWQTIELAFCLKRK
ncbi:MAG: caspase family protein [Aureispira sp.]|nr:caspase family protein [Aureispira sp.]